MLADLAPVTTFTIRKFEDERRKELLFLINSLAEIVSSAVGELFYLHVHVSLRLLYPDQR